jgi:polar amino acid transport system substrate-binding protein
MDLVNGKIDAFVYDLPYMAIANAQKSEGKLVFLDQPFTHEPLAWAVRRGNHDFLNWLNNFMAQVKADGTYDKIYEKWFLSDAWLKQLQ